ncbi:MAG: hypothetical protein HUU21_31320 [Polyangiaceae bacterium]|nr:hypothetical protein [Polyangiaceae bacterium]NUQ78047.1 hypothetical protein [Polyangiaceae bacterium]
MPGRTVSRRMIVGLLGSGVALAPAVGHALAGEALAPSPESDVGKALLAPLAPGDTIGRWKVEAIRQLDEGAVTIAVSGGDRRSFELEILARDPSPIAPRAPGETSRFAIFVRNGGDGFVPTDEEQGLAAMALAEIVRRNEAKVSAEGFLTHEGRFTKHRRSLVKTKGPKVRRGA